MRVGAAVVGRAPELDGGRFGSLGPGSGRVARLDEAVEQVDAAVERRVHRVLLGLRERLAAADDRAALHHREPERLGVLGGHQRRVRAVQVLGRICGDRWIDGDDRVAAREPHRDHLLVGGPVGVAEVQAALPLERREIRIGQPEHVEQRRRGHHRAGVVRPVLGGVAPSERRGVESGEQQRRDRGAGERLVEHRPLVGRERSIGRRRWIDEHVVVVDGAAVLLVELQDDRVVGEVALARVGVDDLGVGHHAGGDRAADRHGDRRDHRRRAGARPGHRTQAEPGRQRHVAGEPPGALDHQRRRAHHAEHHGHGGDDDREREQVGAAAVRRGVAGADPGQREQAEPAEREHDAGRHEPPGRLAERTAARQGGHHGHLRQRPGRHRGRHGAGDQRGQHRWRRDPSTAIR